MPTASKDRPEPMQARTVALTPSLIAQLEERAQLEDRSVSSLIRRMLSRELDEPEAER